MPLAQFMPSLRDCIQLHLKEGRPLRWEDGSRRRFGGVPISHEYIPDGLDALILVLVRERWREKGGGWRERRGREEGGDAS